MNLMVRIVKRGWLENKASWCYKPNSTIEPLFTVLTDIHISFTLLKSFLLRYGLKNAKFGVNIATPNQKI